MNTRLDQTPHPLSATTIGVLLFAHGARTESWRQPFDALRNIVQGQLGATPVKLAFLEFMQPDFAAAVDQLVQIGCQRIWIGLLFLSKGNHTLRDLNELIATAQAKYPQLVVEVSEAIFESPYVLEASAKWVEASFNKAITEQSSVEQMPMRHRISAGVLIEQDNRLLLVNHVKSGSYDFWVPPGGGSIGTEDLRQTAQREALEETGLQVNVKQLAYIEEFYQPGLRYIKHWFVGEVTGGQLNPHGPSAKIEHIVQAQYFSKNDLLALHHYPEFIKEDYWVDRKAGFASTQYRGIRAMKFW